MNKVMFNIWSVVKSVLAFIVDMSSAPMVKETTTGGVAVVQPTFEKFIGKCSWFGGPEDHGVKTDEGLALYPDHASLEHAPPQLFLTEQPVNTIGTARRLNPNAYYCAMRWEYHKTPIAYLRKTLVTVKNPKTGKIIMVHPADWGPNVRTGRIIDLSHGAINALGLETDDKVEVEVRLP